ncbi:MAG: carboxypeptidase regulatory-like domain-containing protein, partial [Candidatus Latescibacteria bacterium]|nr:carboxypeptidase regulatory-like domain-containing protein [Candidatus Latescibacterota bacterium]
MKAVLTLMSTTLLVLIFSCSDNGDNNPTGLGNGKYSLTGKIVNIETGYVLSDVSITITAGKAHETITTDNNGEFILNNCSAGSYRITPDKEGYEFGPREQTVTVSDGDCVAGEFLAVRMTEDQHTIAGSITDTEGKPVSLCLYIVDSKGDSVLTCTNNKGYYGRLTKELIDFNITEGETYTIIPGKQQYIFTPDTCYVTIRDKVNIGNFSSEYLGSPVQKISGRVIDYTGKGLYGIYIWLSWEKNDITHLSQYYTDKDGMYQISGLENGTYHLEFESYDYTFVRDTVDIIIEDDDVTIQDIQAWNNYTYYTVYGKVIDPGGTGLPNISIDIFKVGFFTTYFEQDIRTDSDGTFVCEMSVNRNAAETIYRFIPHKNGYSFNPDSTDVTLSWLELKDFGEDVTLPDFTGYDFASYSASDYFPLKVGLTWTYTRTEDDNEPYDFSVNVTGTVNNDGQTYNRFSEPGSWNFTDYRIENNNVYALSGDEEVL